MSKSILPEWLAAELPEVEPPSVVSMAGEKIRVTTPDGEYEDYDSLQETYDASRQLKLIIEDEVYRAYDQEPNSFGLFFSTSKHFSSALLSLTDADRLRVLESAYEHSLRCHIRYQADPASFYNAYHFVDAHPAFWHRHAEWAERFPWDWETAGHCARVSQYVMKVEKEEDNPEAYPQGYVIALETGCHVETVDPHFPRPAYTSHYHDYKLDVYELTFELAFIELARLVDKFFYIDGTKKEDVDHVKPAWIVELEYRMEELDRIRDEEVGEGEPLDGDSES